jgi:hypothetical protein
MTLDARGNAAARILFTGVGFGAHDALSYFHDEANKRIHPKTSENCRNNNAGDRAATNEGLECHCSSEFRFLQYP